ncbi:DNA-binding transcriptional regulator, MerR family [Saccharopolyspora antimicrobica]|uniref:DNA-binding transcriptional MerR regulator n=1 Tax=Saccharopolyspora antimicrobica TaxID=455193 RepID=A0A1I5DBU0_9PSEU|nr:MerR family transcriptional regulator [Saccharopolyspora antimicrobica]RKT85174.1 DNA-binding transcriptional MerR regulator [Saccharopolyspora antimicrobica]SFN96596.1 DNA-binding transcriptional regulator, MerR family [Saccharopolyspora antimicrobica]
MSRVTTRPEPAPGEDTPVPIDESGRLGTSEGAEPGGDDEPRLSVAAVARRLGVAPATLRTWDRRYGLGPSDHTSGRHRRYGPADIARLEQMQRALLRGASPMEAARYARTVAAPPPQRSPEVAEQPEENGDGPVLLSGVLDGGDDIKLVSGSNTGGRGLKLTGAGPEARGLGRAALALDSWSVQRLLIEAMDSDGVVAAWQGMLQPVLRAVSERRQRSGSGVEVLQLLVDCASTALRSVIANAPAPLNPRPVVLAPVPGEAQELELVALAAALAANRVGHRLFGAALPREGLAAAVRRSAPAAVVLWADQPHYAAPRVLEDIPITRQRARAFVAGAGWSPEALPAHAELLGSLETAVARVSETVLG